MTWNLIQWPWNRACLREVYLVQSCILFLKALLATFQGQAQGHTALTITDMLMTHKTITLLVLWYQEMSSWGLEELESCIQDVWIWMRTNLLRLNNDKTKFLIIITPQQLAKVRTTSIKIGTNQIQHSESACNQGYFYNSTMKSCTHINKLSSMLYITIKRISRIRYTIDLDTTKTLVQALVTIKLDYCNSLMLGTPGYNISKLQHIQDAAARMVHGKGFVLHITPYLKELHWLKVTERNYLQDSMSHVQMCEWNSSQVSTGIGVKDP